MSEVPTGPPPGGYPIQPPTLPLYGEPEPEAGPDEDDSRRRGERWRPSVPSVAGAPVRLGVALVLVGAAAAVLLAVLVSLATLRADDYAFLRDFSFVVRLQVAASVLTPGVLLVLPLALLLAGGGERDGGPALDGRDRTVVVAATSMASALAFVVFLRLVADLAGQLSYAPAETRLGAFLYDAATLAVAVAAVWWGYAMLQPASPATPGGEAATGPTAMPPPLPPAAYPPPGGAAPSSGPSPWARPAPSEPPEEPPVSGPPPAPPT